MAEAGLKLAYYLPPTRAPISRLPSARGSSGHDLRANADRFSQRVVEQRAVHRDLLAPELSGEVAVILEAVGRGIYVRAGLDNDLAAIQRLERRDLIDPLPEQIRHAMQGTRSFERRQSRPRPLIKRSASRANSALSIVNAARGTRPIGWFDAGLTVSKVLPLLLALIARQSAGNSP